MCNEYLMNTTSGFLCRASQDSLVLQMLDLANRAVAAAGHQASLGNTNRTKQSPHGDGLFFFFELRQKTNFKLLNHVLMLVKEIESQSK